ncbi:D-glycerate dehydrogenase [Candidatus Bathyarchaeota archaeon]|nr:D-glycerate dehydrogenase [Candidatus Bathyarchaeota archaeon]
MTEKKARVLVTIDIHDDALARLEQEAEVDLLSPSAARSVRISAYDGIISYVPRLDSKTLSKADRLKVVSCHSPREIDLSAAAEQGIRVTQTPALWETVADITVALMLAAARMIPQAHIHVKNGQWKQSSDKNLFSGTTLHRKVLGIVGLGRIGAIVAKRVIGFEMKTIYYDVVRKPQMEEELGIGYKPLRELMAEADFVSIHVPLSDETRDLIGEEELGAMKREAILINTARGPVVDEQALYRALEQKRIAGAALDVYREEPLKPMNPLLALSNVVLTPHLAGSTRECDMEAVMNVIQVLRGEISPNEVT